MTRQVRQVRSLRSARPMLVAGAAMRDAEIAAALATARRELLALAVADSALDDTAAAIASARLRWAISAARPLIAAADPGEGELHARRAGPADALDRIANRAQRWLVDEPARPLREIAELIDRTSARTSARGSARGAAHPGERAPVIPAIRADHAVLVDLDLDDLDLDRISLRGAHLTELSLRRARCTAADASDSRWQGCALDRAVLTMAVLAGARVERCDLSAAALDGTSWHRATAVHCALRQASLVDTRLDRAELRDCDLRGADLGIARTPHVAPLVGARFVRCDLRETHWGGRELGGATFIECKLFGARGGPALAGVLIERPDLSRCGDGSQIATQSDVVASWS